MSDWELPKEPYRDVLVSMKEQLKMYLGYPPHNTEDNKNKRNPVYLQLLEARYGRTLSELLEKTGMVDYGETAPPAANHLPQARMIRALKLLYGVEELYFGPSSKYSFTHEWVCTTDKTMQLNPISHPKELETLLKQLDGETSSRIHLAKVTFLNTGNEHKTLDSLREEFLVAKLSGLL